MKHRLREAMWCHRDQTPMIAMDAEQLAFTNESFNKVMKVRASCSVPGLWPG